MPGETKQNLLNAATTRFYRDGFRNVGLDGILADVGISKTAFYKHFESKDDLMLAVLESKQKGLRAMLDSAVARAGGGFAALFDVVAQIVDSDWFHGCIFVNAAIEFPLPHEPAHQAAAKYKREFEDYVRDVAAAAGAADPRALAQELCLIIEGTYITRQVTGSPDTMTIFRRLADRAIAAHLGPELSA